MALWTFTLLPRGAVSLSIIVWQNAVQIRWWSQVSAQKTFQSEWWQVRKKIQTFSVWTKRHLLTGLWWVLVSFQLLSLRVDSLQYLFILSVCSMLQKGQSGESFALTAHAMWFALWGQDSLGWTSVQRQGAFPGIGTNYQMYKRSLWFSQDDFAWIHHSKLCPPRLVEASLCWASLITWFHLALLWHFTIISLFQYYFTSVSCQGCFRSVAVLRGEPWSFAWAQHFRCNVQEGRLVLRFVTWIIEMCYDYSMTAMMLLMNINE
jgi:hypothetical protein